MRILEIGSLVLLTGVLLSSFAACGGGKDGTGGSGGTGATSGTGGAGTTGSASSSSTGGPPQPISQGAWSISFLQGDPAMCGIPTHDAAVGKVSASSREEVVVDGVEAATVTCAVKGAGPFEVHGKVSKGGASLEILVEAISPGASEAAPVNGLVAYASSTKTAGNVLISPDATPCQFYFTANTPQTVAAGKVWVTFTCPELTFDVDTCSIPTGYAILENCADE